MKGDQIRRRLGPCPYCGQDLTRGTMATDHPVVLQPGLYGICYHCGELAVVGDDLAARKPTARETVAVYLSPIGDDVERMQRSIAMRRRVEALHRTFAPRPAAEGGPE